VLAFAILAVMLNIFPDWRQVNWDLIALALPIHLAFAGAVWMRKVI
jgi:hypothetical protein